MDGELEGSLVVIKGIMNSVRRALNVCPLEPRENEKKKKRKEEGTVVKSELKWRVMMLKGWNEFWNLQFCPWDSSS